MKATISIICHRALDHAKNCISSVLNGGGDFDLILHANANLEALRYFCGIKLGFPRIYIRVFSSVENEGFIPPNVRALEITETPLFVMLNDDCIVPAGWMDKISAVFKQYPNAAVVGPIGRRLRDDFIGGVAGEPIEYIEGCCLAVRTDLAKAHGLFDPEIKFAYTEDADLCLRMQQLGHTIHLADFPIIHRGGTTSRHVPEVRAFFIKNHEYMRTKWAHYLQTRKFNK